MRVFICFEGSLELFDLPPDQTVGAIKQMVKEYFHVQLSDDNQVRHYLELSCAGASLQDSWALCDVGITAGSAIRCLIKTERKPVISVFNAVTGETIPIMGSVFLLRMSVSRLKTIVSVQSGLPISAFRLSTSSGVQLYDCNRLHDYDIKVGTILRLDTWDGWVEFLQGCFSGHKLTVQSHLLEEKSVMRFQLRVALYITAFAGHLDLAGWLLERGVRTVEPVGVHPYRQWCHQSAHQDTRKCPIHVAAENNQLLILKLFVAKNLSSLACRDPGGRDPLKIAIQHGHRDCVTYLANKLCAVISLPNISLPMRIYLQIKHWAGLGQSKAATQRCYFSSAPLKDCVGDTMLVDGFTKPKMSSKSRKSKTKPSRVIRGTALQPLPSYSNSPWDSRLPHKGPSLQLPSLGSTNSDNEAKQKKRKQSVKCKGGGRLDAIKEEDSSQCSSRVLLPPLSPNSSHVVTASVESFSRQSGRTPRENAVYCMTIASTFTERPWQKQLNIARTLIRKRIQTQTRA
ncbi:protein ANKUB1-like [Genypterus blacodes]|uniref:protein ANKUB1-like n=1 Tax=Genypterus blacodes TaxID=154954 RepID=UPI003F77734E